MKSILKQLQPQLNKYAQILNSILEVDVEIIDSQLTRISGTGIYQDVLDMDIHDEGFIYASVFENKGDRIVLDILNHPICSKCEKRETCVNKLIIAVPIMLDKEAIGTIGIISTEEGKKKYIKSRLRQYLEFVHHISDLISAKAREAQSQQIAQRHQEMWMGIVDNIEHGVIILGSSGAMRYINDIGRDLLEVETQTQETHIGITKVEESAGTYDQISLLVGGKTYVVIGKIVAMHNFIQDYEQLIIINRLVMEQGDVETVGPYKLVGDSTPMRMLQEKIRKIANSPSTVLICGESGTGKELIAQEIHRRGSRRDNPFVAVNCGAIPEPLLESELFGYVKGAFTGANLAGKVGKFELANGGILFLDEIGDMPLLLQVKILRVLQEKKLYRVGSNKVIDLDIKIIAATNKNLEELCEKGLFRVDLYYRLNVIQLEIPPLRERKQDILSLFRHFVDKYSETFGVRRIQIAKETEACINRYEWMGNVRELENAVEYAMNFVADGDSITPELLPPRILAQSTTPSPAPDVEMDALLPLLVTDEIVPLEQMNKQYLTMLLEKHGSGTESKKMIAQRLGIGTATLYRMLNR